MPPPLPDALVGLLTAARGGDAVALGTLLDYFRLILTRSARRAMPEDLRGKVGASDLVQETFLEASRDFHQFQGSTDDELLAWLRCLLRHNFVNALRRYRDCAKRQLNREVTMHQPGQSGGPHHSLASPAPSPCQEVIRREAQASLRQALAGLPDRYRQVLRLRYHEKLSHDDIGSRLGLSGSAVRKLCARALHRLGKALPLEPGASGVSLDFGR